MRPTKERPDATLGQPGLLALVALLAVGCTVDSIPTVVREGGAAQFSWLDDAEWGEPVHLGSEVNSVFSDFDPSVSKDGLTLYFTAGVQRGGFGLRDIWVAKRASVDAAWGTPTNLGSVINTTAHESKPSISADGHRLYFASNRTGGFGQFDIYVSYREHKHDESGWGAPVNLGSVINTAGNEESGITFFEDDAGVVTMFLSSQRAGGVGGLDIYSTTLQADGSFGPVQLVAELSTSAADVDPSVRKDGLELFLASNRTGTFGANDLWVSRRASTLDAWSAPVNLGGSINTPPRDPSLEQANDSRPWLSHDGTTLYFNAAFRAGNLSEMFDIWSTTRSKK
ncbi:MAG: hypothetical protein ACRENU_00720 [Gemmatimonadaceae bacterium]